ncbi:MAG: hypothetical protein ABW079_07280 [Sedimenticola sp.]
MKQLLRNIKKYSLLLSVVLGCIVGGFVLVKMTEPKGQVKFDELALGEENSIARGVIDGVHAHCHDLSDDHRCFNGYTSSGFRDVVLWLGNSQVHAINQMKPGDETASHNLHRRFRKFGTFFLTFSQPNASLQEHYLLFEYLLTRLPIRTLILPVVFDDMRESGIRTTLRAAFENAHVVEQLSTTVVGQGLISNHGEKDSSGNDLSAIEDTMQVRYERYLNESLAEIFPVWEGRPDLRGRLFVALYKLRNWVFDITPASVREIIPGSYLRNKEALQAILLRAKAEGVKVLVYVVPLRNDVKIPYDPSQYQYFKKDIRDIADSHDARFINLETLVPSKFWGTKNSTTVGGNQELDFMHFQAEGHRLLADALFENLFGMGHKESGQ